MVLGAVLVVPAVLLLVWAGVRRPQWFVRAGRAILRACEAAGRWYAPMDPRPPVDVEDRLNASEAMLVRDLLAGVIQRRDYQRGMAMLAALDDLDDPLSVPPRTDV